MSRRRKDPEAGKQGAATEPEAKPPLQLPSSGLASEILAAIDEPRGAVGPPAAPAGPGRIYSFADSFERREERPSAPVEREESWVAFELAGETYALPVARIQEIQRAHDITRVPHAPTPVRGITNLRGKVLVVVDLRVRLGLQPAPLDARSRILVVSSRERALGLLVDAARQVIKLAPSRIERPPADILTERSEFLVGVVQLGDGLIVVLDIDQLLLVPEALDAPGPGSQGAA